MKKWLVLFTISVIAISACGCARQDGKVLAKINDKVITLGEFNNKIERLPKHYQDIIMVQQKKFLDEIIREELLYQEGLRLKIDQDAETQEVITEARKKIIVARFINDKVNNAVQISDDELKKYYDEHSEEFMLPERWRASHILLSTRQEAEGIIAKLREGEPFDQLARESSTDATSKQGGDVGYFSKGQLIPEFEETCFSLEVGEMSDVVETQFGYHIIKLTERKSPELQEFDDISDLIKKELDRERKKEVFEEIMSDLREKADIVINEELIEEPEKEPEEAQPAE